MTVRAAVRITRSLGSGGMGGSALPASRCLASSSSTPRAVSSRPSSTTRAQHTWSECASYSGASLRTAGSRTQVGQTTASQQRCNRLEARTFHSSPAARHGGIERPKEGTGVKVTFRDSKGQDLKTVECNEGDDLLSIAHEYDIDLEGACEGSIACSTCHVILEPDAYDKLEEPGDDENDMLDLAFGLTDTSRLGCQVKLTRELDGLVAQLPSATRNMYVDGHKAGH